MAKFKVTVETEITAETADDITDNLFRFLTREVGINGKLSTLNLKRTYVTDISDIGEVKE